jgi:hypothetical protein
MVDIKRNLVNITIPGISLTSILRKLEGGKK